MSYQIKLYRIIAQTHLHVGSGKQNYGIIDNLVQRDSLSDLPVINGSSLKGALREFFTNKMEEGRKSKLVQHVFGKENYKNEDHDNSAGNYRFFDANLLSLPIRSDQRPFFRVSSPQILSHLKENLKNVALSLKETSGKQLNNLIAFQKGNEAFAKHFDAELKGHDVVLEEFEVRAKYDSAVSVNGLGDVLGSSAALVDNKQFSTFCDNNHLPVIARNSLENGRSTNLWYEQIIPRQSCFYTMVLIPNEDEFATKFEEILKGDSLIQIGANASIGYGFCKFETLPTSNNN